MSRLSARPGIRATVGRYRLVVFGALVVLFTVAVAAANLGRETAPFALVFVPAVAAVIAAAVADGASGIGRIFRRLARWRAAPRWYLAALGVPLAMWAGVGVGGWLAGDPPDLALGLSQVPLVLLVVLLPAFIEEFGWRGYAVPASPRSWPLIVTALVVGVLFIIPHLALYLPGGLYENLPLWPLPLILLSGSILFTWVFVGSGGSAFLAALMHAAMNGLTPLSRGIDPVLEWQLHGIVVTIIAVMVVLVSRHYRRSRRADGAAEDWALAENEAPAPAGAS